MRVSIAAVLLAAAALTGSGPQQQGIIWLPIAQAKAMSQQTGRPILAFVACEPKTGVSQCGKTDKAFLDPAVLKRQDEFYFVRVTDRKTAQDCKASLPAEAIFIDADGDEIFRSGFSDARSLEQAMTGALQKYVPREVSWAAALPKAAPGEDARPWIVAFVDERKDSVETLKALEDRALVKYQDRIGFVKLALRRDSEEAKKWGVLQAPTIVVVDSARHEPLEKLAGRKGVKDLKAALCRALAKLERK